MRLWIVVQGFPDGDSDDEEDGSDRDGEEGERGRAAGHAW
jgi:hypothetical protein